MSGLLGVDALISWPDLFGLAWRLALDLGVATLVIRTIYLRLYGDREYAFAYYALNVITTCLCLLLSKVQTQFGLALALFGVFGILRYRTEQIRVRDITYLFIVISIGVLNGLASRRISLAELLLVNGIIVGLLAYLERESARPKVRRTDLWYDQLALLKPGNEERLLADLSARTGLNAISVEIGRFDLLRDAAEITVISRESP